MTKQRQISINIALKELAKHKVLNINGFMLDNKDELIKTFKEAETTEHWGLIPAKVNELLKSA